MLHVLRKLRLRHKLALSLLLAALLPVVVSSTVAVTIVLRGLERGLAEQTMRQLRVAMSLVLRHVERLGGEAVKLASAPELIQAIGASPAEAAEVLAREEPHLPPSLAQVLDSNGRALAARAIGGSHERFASLAVASDSPIVQRGLAYERRVNISPAGDLLVVRAIAPVVDPSFDLRGVVVMSFPLDGDFADGIKGALGADVLIHSGDGHAMSSFVDHNGGRLGGI
ncbi:MAG: hypothetical protein V2A73_21815, partial [Pseudomonadota bacterium]